MKKEVKKVMPTITNVLFFYVWTYILLGNYVVSLK